MSSDKNEVEVIAPTMREEEEHMFNCRYVRVSGGSWSAARHGMVCEAQRQMQTYLKTELDGTPRYVVDDDINRLAALAAAEGVNLETIELLRLAVQPLIDRLAAEADGDELTKLAHVMALEDHVYPTAPSGHQLRPRIKAVQLRLPRLDSVYLPCGDAGDAPISLYAPLDNTADKFTVRHSELQHVRLVVSARQATIADTTGTGVEIVLVSPFCVTVLMHSCKLRQPTIVRQVGESANVTIYRCELQSLEVLSIDNRRAGNLTNLHLYYGPCLDAAGLALRPAVAYTLPEISVIDTVISKTCVIEAVDQRVELRGIVVGGIVANCHYNGQSGTSLAENLLVDGRLSMWARNASGLTTTAAVVVRACVADSIMVTGFKYIDLLQLRGDRLDVHADRAYNNTVAVRVIGINPGEPSAHPASERHLLNRSYQDRFLYGMTYCGVEGPDYGIQNDRVLVADAVYDRITIKGTVGLFVVINTRAPGLKITIEGSVHDLLIVSYHPATLEVSAERHKSGTHLLCGPVHMRRVDTGSARSRAARYGDEWAEMGSRSSKQAFVETAEKLVTRFDAPKFTRDVHPSEWSTRIIDFTWVLAGIATQIDYEIQDPQLRRSLHQLAAEAEKLVIGRYKSQDGTMQPIDADFVPFTGDSL